MSNGNDCKLSAQVNVPHEEMNSQIESLEAVEFALDHLKNRIGIGSPPPPCDACEKSNPTMYDVMHRGPGQISDQRIRLLELINEINEALFS